MFEYGRPVCIREEAGIKHIERGVEHTPALFGEHVREVDLAVSRAGKREARELCVEELRNRCENDAMHTKHLALIADANYDFAVCQPVVVPP